MKFIHIPVNGPMTEIDTEDYDSSYEAISRNVNGWIEAVALGEEHVSLPNHSLYLNEEGKLDNLPINDRATTLTRGVLSPYDIVVGDVVITGPVDEEGEETSHGIEDVSDLEATVMSRR